MTSLLPGIVFQTGRCVSVCPGLSPILRKCSADGILRSLFYNKGVFALVAACIIQGIMILLFVSLGIIFAKGKGQNLIAGYNVASEKERAKYDEKKLLRIVRNGMFAFAACVAISMIGTLANSKFLMNTGYLLLFIIAIVLVVRANTAAKK